MIAKANAFRLEMPDKKATKEEAETVEKEEKEEKEDKEEEEGENEDDKNNKDKKHDSGAADLEKVVFFVYLNRLYVYVQSSAVSLKTPMVAGGNGCQIKFQDP